MHSDAKHGIPPFWIIPGHQSGTISSVCTSLWMEDAKADIDPTSRFMLTAGGNRGWGEATTEVLMGYDINVVE